MASAIGRELNGSYFLKITLPEGSPLALTEIAVEWEGALQNSLIQIWLLTRLSFQHLNSTKLGG